MPTSITITSEFSGSVVAKGATDDLAAQLLRHAGFKQIDDWHGRRPLRPRERWIPGGRRPRPGARQIGAGALICLSSSLPTCQLETAYSAFAKCSALEAVAAGAVLTLYPTCSS
ncbi:hypothetical protein AB0D92_19660 [Streptomyces parvus]|uniref:hypothetical protein n=1 Tax=Streptomyces parvus TaxID=66428 RepID=UPI0034020377